MLLPLGLLTGGAYLAYDHLGLLDTPEVERPDAAYAGAEQAPTRAPAVAGQRPSFEPSARVDVEDTASAPATAQEPGGQQGWFDGVIGALTPDGQGDTGAPADPAVDPSVPGPLAAARSAMSRYEAMAKEAHAQLREIEGTDMPAQPREMTDPAALEQVPEDIRVLYEARIRAQKAFGGQ